MEYAQLLVSRKDATTEELYILSNSLKILNFIEMFRKIMQQDNVIWEALAMLKELK